MKVSDLALLARKMDPKKRTDEVLANISKPRAGDIQFGVSFDPGQMFLAARPAEEQYIMEYHANGPPTYRRVDGRTW